MNVYKTSVGILVVLIVGLAIVGGVNGQTSRGMPTFSKEDYAGSP